MTRFMIVSVWVYPLFVFCLLSTNYLYNKFPSVFPPYSLYAGWVRSHLLCLLQMKPVRRQASPEMQVVGENWVSLNLRKD